MALSAFAFPSYIIAKGVLTDSCKQTSLSSSRSLATDLPSPCRRPNNSHVRFTSLSLVSCHPCIYDSRTLLDYKVNFSLFVVIFVVTHLAKS